MESLESTANQPVRDPVTSAATGAWSGLSGLSAAEVAERIALGQVNRTPSSDWADYREIIRRNVFTLFNALVAPAAVALFFLREYPSAWAVSALALINSAIGLVQEIRAKRHLDKLAILVETKARVLRDSETRLVPAGDVVLGDHIVLAAGEPVVADGSVVAGRFLEVDEALLTGESDPVPRHVGDHLLSGSCCVAGEGVYRADQVGNQSMAQQTSAQARRYHFTASPLQATIDRLIRILTGIAVALCIFYGVLYLVRPFGEADLVKMIAATITSMVPQGLVLMVTLAFTLGAVHMSKRGAVVQRLNAVESMAAVNVLCMDKTGTLTTNRLCLDQVRLLDNSLSEAEVHSRLRLFAWATLDQQSKSIQALRSGLGPRPDVVEMIDQLPFKSQNRYSGARVRSGQGEHILALGAWEALQPYLNKAVCSEAETVWQELLTSGLRLLVFAEARAPIDPNWQRFNGSLDGLQLWPLAIVALSDELRPEAGAVLESLALQGIGFKILSGDNPETVRATIHHLQIALASEPVVAGDRLGDTELTQLIQTRCVFGRLTPRQKIDIVTLLQGSGHHVGMIGDGINDILSIKRADLGIAMGEGSAATKTVAGLVLENNNFELLPATLEEGRTILRNLRRAAKLFLLKNVYTLFLIVMCLGVFGLKFPYQPAQVTLLNALTIGIPAFVITISRDRALRPSRTSFLREVGWFAISTGLVTGIAGLTIMLIASRYWGADAQTQRTFLLSTLILLGLGNLLRVLSHGEGQGQKTDRMVRWLAVIALPVYAITMYWWPLAYFFELTPLTLAQWGVVLAVALPAFLVCKLLDLAGDNLGERRRVSPT
jgi:cation-transporting ATPase E